MPIERLEKALAEKTAELEAENARHRHEEEKKLEKLKKYGEIFANLPIGLTVSDDTGKILESNRIAAQILGIDNDVSSRRTLGGAEWQMIRPDGTPMPGDEFASVRALREQRPIENIEMGIVKPSGETTWLNVSAVPLPLEGYGVVVNFSDITASKQTEARLRQSEAQYRRLVEDSHDVIYTLTREGIFSFISAAWTAQTGHPVAQVLGQPFHLFVHPDDVARCAAFLQRVFETGQRQTGIEFRVRHADLAWRWFLSDGVPLKDADGVVDGFEGIAREITEHKQIAGFESMSRRILGILNQSGDLQDVIGRTIAVFREWTGADAIGLRLQDGEDFPYFVQAGFSDEFLEMEPSREECGVDGGLCQDADGKFTHDCPCGLVLSGTTDPGNPHFTAGGSFWTNDFSPAADAPPGGDQRLYSRNRCLYHGYVSIALVPIRNGQRIVGVLQCNARRPGVFNAQMIAQLENITAHIGETLMRRQAEENLHKHDERLQNLRRIDKAILLANEPPEVIVQAALKHLKKLLGCQRASIGIFDLKNRTVRIFATDTDDDSIVQIGRDLDDQAFGLLGPLQQGVTEIIENTAGPLPLSAAARIFQAEGIRAGINVPLVSSNKLYGVLNIGWYRPRTVTPEETEIAEEVAGEVTIAIEQASLLLETTRHAGVLEERVAARTAQLETANQELEAFSYSVSHDLRAPLRGIDGWSLALLEDCGDQLDEKAHGYLDKVRFEAQRMGRLIDDLLQLSRVSRGEMQVREVDLSSLAGLIIGRLQETAPERVVTVAIQPGLSAIGDAALVSIMLTNLLENAWKFTGRTPDARIEFGREADADGKNRFFVRDNGAGFDMRYAGKIFGAFQRLHTTAEYPGTGIGLVIVHRIIRRHGGRIQAEAQPGRGAVFHFTLHEEKP